MDEVEQRFLAAIQANPDDREAREVYADWLEERGDERGEYLRLEAQLHSIPMRLAALRPTIDRAWLKQVERRFDVVLVSTGANKISVIKCVREVVNIGLRDAKDLVEGVRPGDPHILCRDLEYEARIGSRTRSRIAVHPSTSSREATSHQSRGASRSHSPSSSPTRSCRRSWPCARSPGSA